MNNKITIRFQNVFADNLSTVGSKFEVLASPIDIKFVKRHGSIQVEKELIFCLFYDISPEDFNLLRLTAPKHIFIGKYPEFAEDEWTIRYAEPHCTYIMPGCHLNESCVNVHGYSMSLTYG